MKAFRNPGDAHQRGLERGRLMAGLARYSRDVLRSYADGAPMNQGIERDLAEGGFTRAQVAEFLGTTARPDGPPPLPPSKRKWLDHLNIAIPTKRDHEHYIYVIGFGPYVKIGFTRGDLFSRLSGIQNGAPERLEVYGVLVGERALEREIHHRFASLRLQREWFRREGDLDAWIKAGCPLDGAK